MSNYNFSFLAPSLSKLLSFFGGMLMNAAPRSELTTGVSPPAGPPPAPRANSISGAEK